MGSPGTTPVSMGGRRRREAGAQARRSPAGPAPEETGSWRVSLGESEATGRKAARGAGYDSGWD
jgi:hypothetical protein